VFLFGRPGPGDQEEDGSNIARMGKRTADTGLPISKFPYKSLQPTNVRK
jgi:hypothetical protein